MAKGGGETQTVTNLPDKDSRRRSNEYWGMAKDFYDLMNRPGSTIAGADPATMQALKGYQNVGGTGIGLMNSGFGGAQDILGRMAAGDYSSQFNPFQSEVLSGIAGEGDRQAGMAINRAAQDATGAHAFGGSRSGLLQAQALRDVNNDTANRMAQYRYQGFNDAAGRMAGLANAYGNLGQAGANMGLAGIGGMAGLGEYLSNLKTAQNQEPYNRILQAFPVLQGGLGGGGYTTTQQMPSNGAGGFLGGMGAGAGIGGAIGGPLGAGIGAGLGGIISLF